MDDLDSLCAGGVCYMDWTGFWPSIIATFIGVFSALIAQKIYEDLKEAKEAKDAKNKIRAEVAQIAQNLASIKENDIWVLCPIKMPIYQGLINSAKISLLDRYVWYEELLSLYNELSTYNSWCEFRLTDCTEDKVDMVDGIIKDIEGGFLGDDFESCVEKCSLPVCIHLGCCETDRMKLKGTINCLLAKVSSVDKSDLVKKPLLLYLKDCLGQGG